MLNQRPKSSSRKPPKTLVTTTMLILHGELWFQGSYYWRVTSPKAGAVAAGWGEVPRLWPGAWAAPRSWGHRERKLMFVLPEQHSITHSEESWASTLNSTTGLLLGCSASPFPGKADLLLNTLLRFTPEFCRSTSGCNEPIILIYPHKIGKYLSPCRNFHKAHCDFTAALLPDSSAVKGAEKRMHPSSDQLIQLENSGKLSNTWSCYVCRLTQLN